MTAVVFVDTNVLIYARDATDPQKQHGAVEWLEQLWRLRCGRISFQVLNEYYVTVTRKVTHPLMAAQAREDIQDLLAWNPVTFTSVQLDDAWSIEDRFGFSWWDSLIVAAARASESKYLLTEDLQHAQSIDALQIVSPFEADAQELLNA